jgi:hypothetical protein
MDNPEILATLGTQVKGQRLETTKGTIKNRQLRDTGNIEYIRHRTRLEKTKETIKNGQPRDTGNIGYTSHRTKVRVNQRDNQEWTTQRYWQHWVHKSQDKG